MVRDESPPVPAGAQPVADAAAPQLTPHAKIARVEAVVNAASGSVGPGAAAALETIVSGFGLQVRVADCQPQDISAAVAAAAAAKPDLLIVLAGDGTARLAAETCGPDGPLLAPLPGGTMNMLPKAFYGDRNWRDALTAALSEGVERPVSGGQIAGHSFYVAAILGSPALWADAREAMRSKKLRLAILRARRALMRAFSGRLRFELDKNGVRHKAEALTLMCPLVSRALTDEQALEAAALDPHGVGEAFRLGLRTAFSNILGDWRKDPAVTVDLCQLGRAWAGSRIPAILDGEPHRLDREVQFQFTPKAFRALAPPAQTPEAAVAEVGVESTPVPG